MPLKEDNEVIITLLAVMIIGDEPPSDEEIEDVTASQYDIKARLVRSLKMVRTELGV